MQIGIAGPNGSGKTTLTKTLHETYSVPLGQYLNPDDWGFVMTGSVTSFLQ
ncbi:ATP-binding cassette domain-containing protein [Brenneria goodwinii]|uniref:ATP-binding cassette domain-containing protein n=1 Tax=Brenneria goodwinii TaxID=1109412 RepID=UPI0012E156C1